MVHIITGEIDEGKTRQMLSIYNQLNKGDGFVSKKIFTAGHHFTGYEIVRLSSGEKMPLAYKSEHVPDGWDEAYRCGPFCFSKAAFLFADGIAADIIAGKIEPVFIDEIGPLELREQGFFALLKKTLSSQKDVYIAVRSHCVEDVIKKFGIRDYETNAISNIK